MDEPSSLLAQRLANQIESMWKANQASESIHPLPSAKVKPYVIFTGGEPLLQLDEALIEEIHTRNFEVAIESNGTLPLPKGVDWICLSPKADAKVVFERCDELKLVYPQELAQPSHFQNFPADYYFLSPMADPSIRFGKDPNKINNTQQALEYCLKNPQWRLSLQMHKLLGID